MQKLKSQISSNELAALIVDSLVDKQLIRKEDFEDAVTATTEEIQVRKALGDYWCGDCENRENG